MIQSAIARLIDFFPDRGFDQVDIDQYNRQTRFEYERIRDFIVLHYKLNQRTDSAFWRQCADMAVPDTLTEKMELFRTHGRVVRIDNELFSEIGWVQVMLGQNLVPERYSPLVDVASDEELADLIGGVGEVVQKCVDIMPDHAAYIRQFCASPR
jgi:tryptophan halogenase